MKARRIAAIVLLTVCIVATVLSFFPEIFPWDRTFVRLLWETVPRAAAAALFLVLLWGELSPRKWKAGCAVLWSIPCFAVALANFPYSALISGSARIVRTDLLWLFLLKCASVAIMEEMCFRALLFPFLRRKLQGVKGEFFLSVLLSAAIFGLLHFFNLLFGAGLAATAMQVGYTFLLGAMFAVMYSVTGNIWLCVATHAVFDVGGFIVPDLGTGAFQDTVFWIVTAVAGVLCAVHIIVSACRYHRRGSMFFFR